MAAVSALGPQGQGRWQGLLGDPGLLAGAAAGFVSAILALWAMRGLPLGTGLFWLASFPLFAAGLGFGAAAAVVAGLLATLLVALVQGGFAAMTYLVLFGVPAPVSAATLPPASTRSILRASRSTLATCTVTRSVRPKVLPVRSPRSTWRASSYWK